MYKAPQEGAAKIAMLSPFAEVSIKSLEGTLCLSLLVQSFGYKCA